MPAETKPMPIPDWMVIDAVRYAIGRMTPQVSVTCEWLREHWADLPASTQEVIKRDLEWEFDRHERNPSLRLLGDPLDVAEWEKVRELWRSEVVSDV